MIHQMPVVVFKSQLITVQVDSIQQIDIGIHDTNFKCAVKSALLICQTLTEKLKETRGWQWYVVSAYN